MKSPGRSVKAGVREELTELEKKSFEVPSLVSLALSLSLRTIVNFIDFIGSYFIFNYLSILAFYLCDYLKYHCISNCNFYNLSLL